MLSEYVVDPARVPWRNGATEGRTLRGQILLSGDDGGPEAIRFRFDPTLSMYAHMHLVSQFQLLLGGSMDLPKDSMKLRPVGVHYTDHNRPYGPFSVGGDHDVLVLHPKKGGLISMADRDARRQIHLGGREYSGMEKDADWFPVPGYDGARCKILIPSTLGPEAVIIEFPPDRLVGLAPPVYGRYEVVLRGSVFFGEEPLGPPALRYLKGDEQAAPLRTGPEGATVIFLTYDADALEGGLTGEGIAVAAEEAMAQAL